MSCGSERNHCRNCGSAANTIEMLRNGCDATTNANTSNEKSSRRKWLIESIEQRHNTLKRVAQAIVDHQTEFLDKGPEFIAPLKMQQIADVVGVHVTTVARAVDDKWMQTPRGIFPLKRFFGGGTTIRRWRGRCRLGHDPHQAPGNHRQGRQERPAQRRRARRRDEETRLQPRPPHGHEVPQEAQHPVVTTAPAVLSRSLQQFLLGL